MAKSKKSKKDSKAEEKKAAAKAAAKAKAKAAAKLAALSGEAKKARKTADKAVKAADKAEAKAVAAGATKPAAKPDEAELLRLALRAAEAKLTDAERRVEALQQQIAGLHRRDEDEAEAAIEDAIVEAAVAATVEEAVIDAELAGPALANEAEEVEVVAIELDTIAAEAAPESEPSHEGDAAESAAVFAASDLGTEPTVTTSELTPPLPEEPASDEPNASWTLLRLRAEAKRRGLVGTSNLPKSALVERLQQS